MYVLIKVYLGYHHRKSSAWFLFRRLVSQIKYVGHDTYTTLLISYIVNHVDCIAVTSVCVGYKWECDSKAGMDLKRLRVLVGEAGTKPRFVFHLERVLLSPRFARHRLIHYYGQARLVFRI